MLKLCTRGLQISAGTAWGATGFKNQGCLDEVRGLWWGVLCSKMLTSGLRIELNWGRFRGYPFSKNETFCKRGRWPQSSG